MSDVVIKVRESGPILITGPVSLTDHLGNKYDTGAQSNIALCRCGHSQKKPFCDGSHKTAGFVANETAPVQPVE
jgi:CDGSH-type Zn-finger protein